MANITPVNPSSSGSTVTYAAASAGGDTITKAKNASLLVRNGSASSITVTLTSAVNCSLGFPHDVTATCAVGDTEVAIPDHCVDPATGDCAITYSAATSVTVAAVA